LRGASAGAEQREGVLFAGPAYCLSSNPDKKKKIKKPKYLRGL
jgi:hypothetical protein